MSENVLITPPLCLVDDVNNATFMECAIESAQQPAEKGTATVPAFAEHFESGAVLASIRRLVDVQTKFSNKSLLRIKKAVGFCMEIQPQLKGRVSLVFFKDCKEMYFYCDVDKSVAPHKFDEPLAYL